MTDYQGWYINKGPLGIKQLMRESAICKRHGDCFMLQFNNTNLPMHFTHGWRPFYKTEIVLQTNMFSGFIFLEYCGKHYRRRIRNGKFQFHGLELTCHSEAAARTTTAKEHETTTPDNN